MTDDAIDFEAVLRDIDEEVRARRASGDFPADMERELDRLFAQYVPAATSADDLGGLIAAAHRTSFIDPEPPTTASRIPGVGLLKATEQRLLGWYFRFFAQQITGFAHTVTQAVEALTKRVDTLASSVQGNQRALEQELRRLHTLAPVDIGPLVDDLIAHLVGANGRVLVLEAGTGALVRGLAERDIDVYGIDESIERAATMAADGLDVRDDEPLLHLRAVGSGSLGGLVLAGFVDRLPLDAQVELADLVTEITAPGAPVAVVGRSPLSWGHTNPVEADLSPGRPLHGATWVHLLEHRGIVDLEVVERDDVYAVRGRKKPS